jgi:quercetin dioxygenase-like cupin family protein
MEKTPRVYPFDKMPLEKLSDKVFRRFIYGENVTLVHFDIKKGAIVTTHHHPSEQMSYVTKGKMKVASAGKEFIVSAGEVIHIAPEVKHQFEALEDSIIIDVFSPTRKDWLEGKDDYLKH